MKQKCRIHGMQEHIKSQGYWTAGQLLCIKCFPNGIHSSMEDIIEQQKIDADCNDCRHFERGAFVKVPGLNYFLGHCRKYDRPTRAYPVQFSGHECFEHRRE